MTNSLVKAKEKINEMNPEIKKYVLNFRVYCLAIGLNPSPSGDVVDDLVEPKKGGHCHEIIASARISGFSCLSAFCVAR